MIYSSEFSFCPCSDSNTPNVGLFNNAVTRLSVSVSDSSDILNKNVYILHDGITFQDNESPGARYNTA